MMKMINQGCEQSDLTSLENDINIFLYYKVFVNKYYIPLFILLFVCVERKETCIAVVLMITYTTFGHVK